MPEGGARIGDVLLEPHRSYLDEVRILRRALREAGGDIHALAHITGGGWEGNVPRTLPDGLGVEIETGSWPVPPHLQPAPVSAATSPTRRWSRTFNLGIGMTAGGARRPWPTRRGGRIGRRASHRLEWSRSPDGRMRVRFE